MLERTKEKLRATADRAPLALKEEAEVKEDFAFPAQVLYEAFKVLWVKVLEAGDSRPENLKVEAYIDIYRAMCEGLAKIGSKPRKTLTQYKQDVQDLKELPPDTDDTIYFDGYW